MRLEDWNKKSFLRMSCEYEKTESYVVAKLPKRIAQWYTLDSLSESDYNLIGEPDKIRVRVSLAS